LPGRLQCPAGVTEARGSAGRGEPSEPDLVGKNLQVQSPPEDRGGRLPGRAGARPRLGEPPTPRLQAMGHAGRDGGEPPAPRLAASEHAGRVRRSRPAEALGRAQSPTLRAGRLGTRTPSARGPGRSMSLPEVASSCKPL
jgi:hypothetical protein